MQAAAGGGGGVVVNGLNVSGTLVNISRLAQLLQVRVLVL